MRHHHVLPLAMLCLTACAADSTDPATEASSAVGASRAGSTAATPFTVDLELASSVVRPPTLSDPGTASFLHARIEVDDAEMTRLLPQFDGLEAPFVLVPQPGDGEVVWQRYPMAWTGTLSRGYFGQDPVDVYEPATPIRVQRPELLSTLGVAVGAETNVGLVWAQPPGANFRLPEHDGL